MQMAYQFPERCERLVLVSSGGLGREVSPLLRAATLPGSELVIPLMTKAGLLDAGRAIGSLLGRVGLKPGTDVEQMALGWATLADAHAMRAFVQTLRASVDPSGQRVDARDRLYLAGEGPTMIVWGARDRIIPLEPWGRGAPACMPGSRFEVFAERGPLPRTSTSRSASRDLLTAFIEIDPARDGRLLASARAGDQPLAALLSGRRAKCATRGSGIRPFGGSCEVDHTSG